jgi:uncharacterized protein
MAAPGWGTVPRRIDNSNRATNASFITRNQIRLEKCNESKRQGKVGRPSKPGHLRGFLTVLFRLDVLRAVIADTTNAAKTSKPVETDIQLLALLRKRAAASMEAAAQFRASNRHDLEEKEMAQVKIVDEYASKVHTLGQDQVEAIIKQATAKLHASGQLNEGSVMKALFGPSGALTGQPVERGSIARRVKELIQAP